eukprot:2224716-Prymnesium_polylepis.1
MPKRACVFLFCLTPADPSRGPSSAVGFSHTGRWPSHADLLGKTAALYFPGMLNITHCPLLGYPGVFYAGLHSTNITYYVRRLELHLTEALGADNLTFRCARYVSPVEHVRHPNQGCEGACRYVQPHTAASRVSSLLKASRAYVQGKALMPEQLLLYGERTGFDMQRFVANSHRTALARERKSPYVRQLWAAQNTREQIEERHRSLAIHRELSRWMLIEEPGR